MDSKHKPAQLSDKQSGRAGAAKQDGNVIRILHVISGLELGGAEIMLANLIARSDRSRFRHAVVSLTTRGDVAAQIEASGANVMALEMARVRPNFSALLRLIAIIRRQQPDIVQTWLYHGDLVGTVAALCARRTRIAWNIQCSSLPETSWFLHAAIKTLALASALPAAVVVNSRAGYETHRQLGYKPRVWVRIPNGVDTDAFRPRHSEKGALRATLGIRPDAFVIGLIARFHPMKDHRTFFMAARQFASSQADALFVLAGTGTEPGAEKIRELADEAGIGNRVMFLGARGDLVDVYPALDLVTLSSAYGEGCPNVLLEAMACGIPSVATDVGDCATIIGDTRRVVEPRDPAALSAAWMQVAAADRIRLGSDARLRVERLYSLQRIIAQYENFYFQLCEGVVSASDSSSASAAP